MSSADLQISKTAQLPHTAPPDRLRQKVAFVALLDGASIVVLGLASLLLGAIFRDLTGFLVGLALATCGAIELRGRKMLLENNPRDAVWLGGSQLGTLLVILVYCGKNLLWPPVWSLSSLPPEAQQLLQRYPSEELNMINDMLPTMLKLTYLAVCLVSLLYQGGLYFYYSWAARKLRTQIPPPVPGV